MRRTLFCTHYREHIKVASLSSSALGIYPIPTQLILRDTIGHVLKSYTIMLMISEGT